MEAHTGRSASRKLEKVQTSWKKKTGPTERSPLLEKILVLLSIIFSFALEYYKSVKKYYKNDYNFYKSISK